MLSVSACWQTESGHDYLPPEEMFPQRVLRDTTGVSVIKMNPYKKLDRHLSVQFF